MVDALKELKDVLIHAVGGLGSNLYVSILGTQYYGCQIP